MYLKFRPSLEVSEKKERKKNWPLLDLSASPQVKTFEAFANTTEPDTRKRHASNESTIGFADICMQARGRIQWSANVCKGAPHMN